MKSIDKREKSERFQIAIKACFRDNSKSLDGRMGK